MHVSLIPPPIDVGSCNTTEYASEPSSKTERDKEIISVPPARLERVFHITVQLILSEHGDTMFEGESCVYIAYVYQLEQFSTLNII